MDKEKTQGFWGKKRTVEQGKHKPATHLLYYQADDLCGCVDTYDTRNGRMSTFTIYRFDGEFREGTLWVQLYRVSGTTQEMLALADKWRQDHEKFMENITGERDL